MASLFVEYESSLLPHLPFPLHTSEQRLVFALQPRSKSHGVFFSKVTPLPVISQRSRETFSSKQSCLSGFVSVERR